MAYSNIPYEKEQGKIFKEQGTSAQEQGNLAKIWIAVGTLIAECPPHRSERAQFGHSAPTSGV
jgi:hypothetical protein